MNSYLSILTKVVKSTAVIVACLCIPVKKDNSPNVSPFESKWAELLGSTYCYLTKPPISY